MKWHEGSVSNYVILVVTETSCLIPWCLIPGAGPMQDKRTVLPKEHATVAQAA